MTKRKKYGKKGHGGEKSHEFFRRFIMRKPVTLKQDKRKIALDIIADFIQSGKNEVDPRTQGNIKDFILGIIVKGTTRLKDICEFEVKIKKGHAKRQKP